MIGSEIAAAARRLWRDRAATLAALLVLGLGLAANTAMFALVEGVLLRPLGFPHPEQLVSIREIIPQASRQFPTLPVNWYSFEQWRREARTLSGLALVHPAAMVMTGEGAARDVLVTEASANLFDVLGVHPALGRGFAPGEDAPGRNHALVLSDAFWHERFGGDPAVLGRTVELDGQACQIVGVLPADFHFLRGAQWGSFTAAASAAGEPQMFLPLAVHATDQGIIGNFDYGVVARLRPGGGIATAESELDGITARLVAQAHQPDVSVVTRITSLRDQILGETGGRLWLLSAAVGAVLLLVVINLANLLLVRAQGRAPEAALRIALGASPACLLVAAAVEAGLLALASGALALGAAAPMLRGLAHSAAGNLPRLDQVRLDTNTGLAAFGLAGLACLASSLWPAWRWARIEPQAALRGSGTGLAGGGRNWTRPALVLSQAALATLLLAVTGLLLHSYYQLDHAPVGFAASPKLIVSADLAGPDAARLAFWRAVGPRVAALPGVAAAGWSTELPLLGKGFTSGVYLDGDTRTLSQIPIANYQFVGPGYFAAMGVRVRGRELRASDLTAGAPAVAVISEATARRVWPGQDALGRVFHPSAAQGPKVTVVGVAADVRTEMRRSAGPMVFQPLAEAARRHLAYLVVRPRAGVSAAGLAGPVRRVMQQVQPAAAVPSARTMEAVESSVLGPERFELELVLAFGLCALLLASLGVYGVVAAVVAGQGRELGIRMCLGAEGHALAFWTFRRGMRPVLAGLALGLGLAIGIAPWLAAQLYGVNPRDPLALAGSGLVLLAVASLACAWPARRAAGADPLGVLRSQ